MRRERLRVRAMSNGVTQNTERRARLQPVRARQEGRAQLALRPVLTIQAGCPCCMATGRLGPEGQRIKQQLPAARLWAGRGRSLRRTSVLVQTNGAALFALNFLGVTFNSGCCFALTLRSRLLVKFAATNFSQNTGFFAGALETTQSYVEGFILFNFDGWHPELPSFITGVNELVAKMCAGERRFLRVADVNP